MLNMIARRHLVFFEAVIVVRVQHLREKRSWLLDPFCPSSQHCSFTSITSSLDFVEKHWWSHP